MCNETVLLHMYICNREMSVYMCNETVLLYMNICNRLRNIEWFSLVGWEDPREQDSGVTQADGSYNCFSSGWMWTHFLYCFLLKLACRHNLCMW